MVIPVVIVLALASAGTLTFLSLTKKERSENRPSSFAECASMGYPIMESYPRRCATPFGDNFLETIPKLSEPVLNNIAQGTAISLPLTIEGSAPGSWFFEASFPVVITDANGKILASSYASAKSDWMTETMVPFSSVIDGFVPAATDGFIVLKNDNPSGLPENEKSVSIPVKILPSEDKAEIKVFFGKGEVGNDCSVVSGISRKITKTPAIGAASLTELLKGPTAEEKKAGYYSSINSGVSLKYLSIENGIAYADFSEKLEEAVGGSCRVAAIRSEITNTLMQFSSVKKVVISINGRTEDILQP